MTRFERTRRIHFSHCDPAGIVFFPLYLVMLNDHVEDWVSEGLGIPYATLIGARRTGLPTVRLECDFRAISRMGEDVTYALRVERLGTRSLTLATEVLGPARELRAAFVQVLVSTDLDTHRAVELPADLRAAATEFAPAPQS